MQPTPIQVLWNAHAGTAGVNQEVLETLERRSDVTVHRPRTAEDARALAEELSRRGAAIVAAGGGDGSVNAVVQGLIAAGARSKLAVAVSQTSDAGVATL